MHRYLSGVAAGVFALLTSLGPATAGASEDLTWDRDFTVGRQPTIRIQTDDARVTVHSWKDSKVKVHVEQRGQTGGFVLGRQRARVLIDQRGNEVRVGARMEGSTTGIIWRSPHLAVEV